MTKVQAVYGKGYHTGFANAIGLAFLVASIAAIAVILFSSSSKNQ